MSEPRTFASLSPSLLARKGAARPAMRPQIQPLNRFHDSQQQIDDSHAEDDLGWNDMGHDEPAPAALEPAEIVPIVARAAPTEVDADELLPEQEVADAPVPEVVRQQESIALRVASVRPVPLHVASANQPRRSALSDGRRAAFTLRVDAERHLKLRLACTIRNRSAQQLVTEALDRLLDELPEVSTLAAQVAVKR